MNNPTNKKRIWELDFFRGVALLLMVYFHAIYDMNEFFGYSVQYSTGFNYYTGKASVILFILISGISCSLSRSNAKRGLKLLGVALLVSLFSYFYNPDFVIKFGIIHFFAVCMLLYPLLNKLNNVLLVISGSVIIALNLYTSNLNVSHDYLFPFGVTSPGFASSDYYSLIPWLGLFLYGIFLGRILYKQKQSLFPFEIGKNPVSFLGKHTLTLYIIHQPVILAILTGIQYLNTKI
ncbi:MAG: DUF1624 domain-containing protein [Clostridia bacterium]|nr:DUF1624 domain-containing protein [Clostridia bacterium]